MNDWWEAFGRAALVGFSVSVPFGPIGVLCVRGAMSGGLRTGLAIGLGASTADALFAAVAALGLTAVLDVLMPWQSLLRGAAGAMLAVLGVRSFVTARKPLAHEPLEGAAGRGYLTSFLLLITNPMAILVFGTVFAGFGFTPERANARSAVAIVLGVFAGTQVWWSALALAAAGLRGAITPRVMQGINIGAGVMLLSLAVLVVWS